MITYKKLKGDSPKLVAIYFTDVIVSLLIIIYSLLSMIFVTGLLIYHIKLTCRNTTTREDLKAFFVNTFGNPYER